jgi:hypothetical protein
MRSSISGKRHLALLNRSAKPLNAKLETLQGVAFAPDIGERVSGTATPNDGSAMDVIFARGQNLQDSVVLWRPMAKLLAVGEIEIAVFAASEQVAPTLSLDFRLE